MDGFIYAVVRVESDGEAHNEYVSICENDATDWALENYPPNIDYVDGDIWYHTDDFDSINIMSVELP